VARDSQFKTQTAASPPGSEVEINQRGLGLGTSGSWSVWSGFPFGSTSLGLTKINRLRLFGDEASERNNLPASGRPSSTGSRDVTSLRVNPPKTNVCPSRTSALLANWRDRIIGTGFIRGFNEEGELRGGLVGSGRIATGIVSIKGLRIPSTWDGS